MSDFVEQLRRSPARRSFPEDGELACAGLSGAGRGPPGPVGSAYISAASLDDLWFAQGFVTAGERFFQMDLRSAPRAAGCLRSSPTERSPTTGSRARSGLHRPGAGSAAGWERLAADDARFRRRVRRLDRTDAGAPGRVLAARLTPEPPTETPPRGRRPFVDLAWGLSGNWDKELMPRGDRRAAGTDAVGDCRRRCALDPPHIPAGTFAGRLLLDALPRRARAGLERLGGRRVRGPPTGKPLLANDPHLLAVQPGCVDRDAPARRRATSAWRGAHVLARILLGTTAHHAWGVTNVTGDVQDLYIEHLSDDGTSRRARRWMGAADDRVPRRSRPRELAAVLSRFARPGTDHPRCLPAG